jgi:hypothetical protein
LDGLSAELSQQLEKLVRTALSARVEPTEQLHKLHAMHQRFATQGFTVAKHGDITGQVDREFRI